MLIKNFLLVFSILIAHTSLCRSNSVNAFNETNDSSDLTISYLIEVVSKKAKDDLGESYNGAVKTVFASDRKIRLRLVSLMRIQSVVISVDEEEDSLITFIRESGKNKSIKHFSTEHWNLLHKKYEGSEVAFLPDRLTILGYECKTARIQLPDKTFLIVYYTDQIKHSQFQHAEPMFRNIPGVVLKYEYVEKKAKLSYTATLLSRDKIDPEVFEVRN